MADIFESEGIEPPKDIFATEGIQPPSIQEQNAAAMSPMPVEQSPPEVQAAAKDSDDSVMQLARARYSDDEIEAIKAKGKIGFWEAQDFVGWQDVVPGGGIKQGKDLYDIYGAAKKLEAGEALDDGEQEKLNKFIDQQVQMGLRGMSVGGGISYYGAQTPAFMIEFALTGGVGKAAAEGVEAGAKKLVKTQVKNKVVRSVGKAAVKAAAVSANVGARTAVMPQRYVPKYAEERLNDYMGVTDKGAIILKESKDSPAKSALKAFAYTTTDVASEMSGAALGKYIVKPLQSTATRYLKTPISSGIQQLPVTVRQNLYQAYKAIQPNAKVSEAFTRMGWNGMLEELGEERVADIMKASFDMAADKDYTSQNYIDAITPSSDQLMIESGIIGITGGVKTGAHMATNLLTEKLGGDWKQAKDNVDNLSASEQEDLVEQELTARRGMKQFVDMAKDSADADEFYAKARDTKGVPQEVAEYFGSQYKTEGTSMEDAAKAFFTDVIDGKWNDVADPVSQAQMNAAEEQDPPRINNEESGFDRFYREFVNGLQPIEDATKEAQARGKVIEPGQNPFVLSRTYAGAIGQIQHNLQYGTTRLNQKTGQFEVTGKAFKAIRDDFDNTVNTIEPDRDAREADWDSYLVARRILEDLDKREDVSVSEKQKVEAVQTMNRLADKYGDEFTWFDTFAKETYEYQQRVLLNLVDAGNLSQQQYDDIIAKNPNYIPFQRVLEENFGDGAITSKGKFTDAKASKVVKRIKGSDKEVKNTTQSIIANTAKIIDIAYRNRVASGLYNLRDILPEYIQEEKTPMKPVKVKDPDTGKEIETFRPSEIAPQGTITVYQDGKRKYLKVSEPLLAAMENLSPVQMNATFRMLTEPFRFSARVLRAGATLIPEFWIRNVIRDQGTALLQSPIRPTPVDMVKGLVSVIGKGDLYQDWMRNGGTFNSYMELDDRGLEKAHRELLNPEGRMMRYAKNPINVLADISQVLEQGTRVGVYGKARRQGVVGIEAALMAREATLDFGRGGVVSRNVNQYVPFFNAGVQSVDKLLRTFKENPKGTALWGLATITVPSVLITGYYLWGAPDEDRREYLEIPQWQKDMFWVFKVNGSWQRIPKPFSFGYLFGSVPERFMTWADQGDKPEVRDFWKELAIGVAGTISPVYDPSAILPPLVKVAIEDLTNYNFFTGRDIYPEWMERYEPEQRKTKYTSEAAVKLGEQLGVSPALLDHTLRGQLAGSADYVTDAADSIIRQVREWNGEEVPAKPTTQSDIPVLKAFAVREPTGNAANSVSNFFDTWGKLQQVNATYNKLEGDEKAEYRDKKQDQLVAYKQMKKYYDRIRTAGKEADRIYKDSSMSSDEKVEALSQNGQAILDTAIQANVWYKETINGE